MDMESLEPWQAKKINEELFAGVNYLLRLMRRMEKRGFPPNDPLYLKVKAAYDASWELSREMHFLSASGVGRPSRPRKQAEQAGEQPGCDETGSNKLPQK